MASKPVIAMPKGSKAEIHVSAGARSPVLRVLTPEDWFEVLYRLGETGDEWLKIRTLDGLEGFIPDDPAIPKPPPPPPAPSEPPESRPGLRDMGIGAAFFVAGIAALWFLSGGPVDIAHGLGKEWIAVGYGGYRFIKGLMRLTEGS